MDASQLSPQGSKLLPPPPALHLLVLPCAAPGPAAGESPEAREGESYGDPFSPRISGITQPFHLLFQY